MKNDFWRRIQKIITLAQQGKKAFGHSAARLLKAKSNRLKCYLCLKIEVKNIARTAKKC